MKETFETYETFMNEKLFKLRTVMKEEVIYFSFKDVAGCINLRRNAYQRISKEDRAAGLFDDTDSKGRPIKTMGVTEPGLYLLILRSGKKEAVPFIDWVTRVVIPSVRANGGYILGQENLPNEERNALMEQIQDLAIKVGDVRKERYSFLKRAGKAEAACLDLRVSLIEKDERLAEYRRNICDEQFLRDRLESLKLEKEEAEKLREEREREARIPYAKPSKPDPNPMGFGPDGLRMSMEEHLQFDRDR